MNAQVSLQHIEMARLMTVLNRAAQNLVELSNLDMTAVFDGHAISITYAGRGSEFIGLFLSSAYTIETRIEYMTENLKRLTDIKKYLLEEMMG